MPKTPQLVCQHLENISGDVLEDYQDIIREYVSRRQGVYALYDDDHLYYVGLASNLSSRLKAHLSDKHAGQWNRFSVYLTIGDKHLRELETLILHVVKPRPEGNSKTGRFARSEDLRARLGRDIKQRDREKRDHIFGETDEAIRVVLPGPMPPLCPYVKKVFRLRGRSKGKAFHASVRDDGSIRLQGKVYDSPSAAAEAATQYPVDGWLFWKYERAPGDWVCLDELRKQQAARTARHGESAALRVLPPEKPQTSQSTRSALRATTQAWTPACWVKALLSCCSVESRSWSASLQ
ncbi:MAG TPA: hypothetical protein VEO19_01405 [Terriglobia bacterium]|nr:hypothetical protein [Terriglobia bacterium]